MSRGKDAGSADSCLLSARRRTPQPAKPADERSEESRRAARPCDTATVSPGRPLAVSLPAMNVKDAKREIAVIGGTLDLGAGRRGVDMGPSAIRYAGLNQQLTEKLGVTVTDAGTSSRRSSRPRRSGTFARATSTRSSISATGFPALSRVPSAAAPCRSRSAVTTRSRWGHSSGWRRRAARAASLGRRAWRREHPADIAERKRAGMALAAALGSPARVRDRRLADPVDRARRCARRRPFADEGERHSCATRREACSR